MSPIFQPPTVADGSRTTPWNQDGVSHDVWLTGNRLMRHYSQMVRGRSVLKIGGVYQTVDVPTQSEIDSATEVYLGGHIYTVTDAVSAALIAAGYTTSASPAAAVRSITWGALVGGTWDDFVDNYGTWG